MKPDGTRSEADHRLRLDELGALHASVRASTSSSRRTSSGSRTSSCSSSTPQGTKEPVRVTYSDGFDGLPVPSPDGKTLAWTSSRARRSGRPALPRAVEPREGARGAEERAAEKAGEEVMRHRNEPQSSRSTLSCSSLRSCDRRGSVRAASPATRRRRRARTSRRSRPPRLEGRLAGSDGEQLASDYIVAELQRIGAKPLPGHDRLPAAVRVHRRHAGRRVDRSRSRRRRRRPRRSTRAPTCRRSRSPTTATSTAPVVFAGYGIVVPDSQDFGYDSYATLDVKDKIVVVLRYFPEDAEPKTQGHPRRATPTSATRRWPRGSTARRRSSSSPGPHSPNAGETGRR